MGADWVVEVVAEVIVLVAELVEVVEVALDCGSAFVDVADVVVDVWPGLALAAIVCSTSGTVRIARTRARRARRRVRASRYCMTPVRGETFQLDRPGVR